MSDAAPVPCWLSVIGIGEDGLAALSATARALIDEAALIVGGARHLAMLGATPDGAPHRETLVWPSPLGPAIDAIVARRGDKVVVLATGDPFFYGVGDLLAARVGAAEMLCLPAPSAFALAAARLCWSQQDCALLSLHGRAFERIAPHLQPGRRLIALSWDGSTPQRLARELVSRGMGDSILHVFEHMGGAKERRRRALAKDDAFAGVAALNTVAVEIDAGPGARILPLAPGLPDDWFEHDGQLTKRDMRALTLSSLAPRRGELLWDLGAGAGSISIEWMLRDPANRAIAVERDPARAARIARNAATLGAPGLEIVVACVTEARARLPAPDAIFIGGGCTTSLIDDAFLALPRGGRLVVNAATLETQAVLLETHSRYGGDLTLIQIAPARPIGRFFAFDPAMPATQWRVTKP